MAFHKLAEGFMGRQVSGEHQGGFRFIGIPHRQGGELAPPLLFEEIGSE